MDSAEISLSPETLTIKKRAGLLDNIRRHFVNLIKPPEHNSSPKYLPQVAYSRQNMTLPRLPSNGGKHSNNGNKDTLIGGSGDVDEVISPSHIIMTERFVSGISIYNPQAKRLSNVCAETPQVVRAKLIQLDTLSGGKGELLPRKDRQRGSGHSFCAIPLELDTFCDYCNQPIWGLGWGPVCQRCADCHMTCHWLCTDNVRVKCESNPPPIRQFERVDEEDLDFTHTPNGSIEDLSSSSTSDPILSPLVPEIASLRHSPIARSVSCEPSGDTKSPHHSSNAGHSQPSILRSPGRLGSTNHSNEVLIGGGDRRFTLSDGLIVNGLVSGDGRRPQVAPVKQEQSQLTASSTLRPGSQFSLFSSMDSSLSASPDSNSNIATSSQSHTLYQNAIESQNSINGKLADISETEADSKEPIAQRPICLNRTSLHQSILRKPPGEGIRKSVRRHTSMIASFPYDISSLDYVDIAKRGISVRQLSPTRSSSNNGGSKSASSSPIKEFPVVMSSVMQATQAAALSGHQVGVEGLNFSKVAIGPRGVLPWSPLELAHRLEIFNGNEFGLTARMTTRLTSGDCEGQVRVHINLIRPVRMVLSSRPPSIFDVVEGRTSALSASEEDSDDSTDEELGADVVRHHVDENEISEAKPHENVVRLRRKPSSLRTKVSSFRLPRGSSKLLHVRLSTTASQVISCLLGRFNIDDNPQKFALYEHTIISDQEVSVRKIFDNESPLGLLLRWTSDQQKPLTTSTNLAPLRERFNNVLTVKRIVLQENETGDIEWTCFSQAELHNFLGILNREEMDYRRRIQLKYQIRKREIIRLLALRSKAANRRTAGNVDETTEIGDLECINEAVISTPNEETTDKTSHDGPSEGKPVETEAVSPSSPSLLDIDRNLLTKAQKKQQRKEKIRLEKNDKGMKKKRPDWLRRKK